MKIHAVPLVFRTVNRETLPVYEKQLHACGVNRIFLCGVGNHYLSKGEIRRRPEDFAYAVKFFKESGFEVCVWLGGFGHGDFLVGFHDSDEARQLAKYTSVEGPDGRTAQHGICPLDENFRRDFCEGVKYVASFGPSIIMFDDDYRINSRNGYTMGCFCEKHKKMFFEKIGEKIDLDNFLTLAFTGKRNKYRDAWMDGLGYSLELLAKEVREAVDTVDPSIRVGVCTNQENCDLSGTDNIKLAKIFAGKNKPFTRVCGAAYSFLDVTRSIEMSRNFFNLFSKEGLEVFSEGDVYPRPRYNHSCSSKQLELMNYALVADGTGDGELNYIVDYYQKPDYETGYLARYEASIPVRAKISEMFDGKRAVGVRAYNAIHKIRDWDMPNKLFRDLETKLMRTANASSVDMLAKNSIPTSFEDSGYPVMLLGENARTFPLEELGCGALLDAPAARILTERGIDTGYISGEYVSSYAEHYIKEDDTIPNVDNGALIAIKCAESAEVITTLSPSGAVSSYRYENAAGQKFFVIGYDGYLAEEKKNFINNYYRQKHLMDAVEWIGGKPLPCVSYKNPSLYTLTKRGEDGSLSVFLANIHLDDILAPVFTLDREYKEIKCLNCNARIEGNKVYFAEKLHGYDYAAFEVK